MTNQEILEKAIRKAIEEEWHAFGYTEFYVSKRFGDWFIFLANQTDLEAGDMKAYSLNDVIYNHDFAKALWGDEPKPYARVWHRVNPGKDVENAVINGHFTAWQYHLQQMVISDDPIKYLGEHLDDE